MKLGGRLLMLTVTVFSVVWGGSGCANPATDPVAPVKAVPRYPAAPFQPRVQMLNDGPDGDGVVSIRSAADVRAAVAARGEGRQKQGRSSDRAADEALPVTVPDSLLTVLGRTSIPTMGMSGLVPNAQRLAAYILSNYPGVQSIGGVRADPIPDHPSGRAIDVMIGSDMGLGDAINDDVQRQSGRFGVVYTLWRVANHFNHVHITVS